MTTYLFVDGGYLREKFRTCMQRYHDAPVEPEIPSLNTAIADAYGRPQKMFYYDCLDDGNREGESPEAHRQRVQAQEDLFNSIRNSPGWHVREGRLVGARRTKRTQKRIDVLLAVEMLGHAFNKNMQRALLLAGDDDFTPLVDELLRHGTYVEVISDRQTASEHLLYAADSARRMGYRVYWEIAPEKFRSAHPFPDYSNIKLPQGGRLLKHGIAPGGRAVKIFEAEGSFHFCTAEANGLVSRLRAKELNVLEQYATEVISRDFLPIEWHASV